MNLPKTIIASVIISVISAPNLQSQEATPRPRHTLTVLDITTNATSHSCAALTIVFSDDNRASWTLAWPGVYRRGALAYPFKKSLSYLKALQDNVKREVVGRAGSLEQQGILPSPTRLVVILLEEPGKKPISVSIVNPRWFNVFESNIQIRKVCSDILRLRDGKETQLCEFLFASLDQPTAAFGFSEKPTGNGGKRSETVE